MQQLGSQAQTPLDLSVSPSPAYIFRRNLWIFGTFQALTAASLLYAAIVKDPRIVTAVCMNLCVAPIFVICTYRECKRAWVGEEPDDMRDVSLPFMAVTAIVFGLRFAIYWLLGS